MTDLAAVRRPTSVVNATGLGARELAGDAELTGVRGQVVRVADPGLAGWTLDEDHPDGMVYVVPRGTDVVCGGTAVDGDESTATRPEPRPSGSWPAAARVVPELAERARCSGTRSASGRPVPRSGWSGRATSCTATGTAAPASRCPGAAPTR